MVDPMVSFQIRGQVDFGMGASALEIPAEGSVVLASQGLEQKSGIISMIAKHNGISESRIFYKGSGEPDSEQVDRMAEQIGGRPERVIAIGGGSTIDMAKGVALLLGSGGKITDYEFGERKVGEVVPVWAIPTTCGSGSEATPYAVINNSETGRKFTLANTALVPQRVLIDPALLTHLGPTTLYAGVLDALIHALEARLNRAGNQMVDPVAEWGLKTILNILPELECGTAASSESLSRYARAAYYGGVSIAHSRTGLIHTLSVALARYIKEPHGILNARIAPYVLHFNRDYYQGELAALLSGVAPQLDGGDDHAAVAFLDHWLRQRTPVTITTLPDPPFDEGELVTILADRVEQDGGLPSVNPRPLSREVLEALIIEILQGEFSDAG